MHSVRVQIKRLCTVADLSTSFLASLFAPLMFNYDIEPEGTKHALEGKRYSDIVMDGNWDVEVVHIWMD